MSIFDTFKDLVSSVGGEDVVANVTEQLPVDGISGVTDQLSEQATNVSEQAGSLGEQAGSLGDQASAAIEDVTKNLGL